MEHHYAFMMKVINAWEPEMYVEAVQDLQLVHAMMEEMQFLVEDDTWELVPLSYKRS